MALQSFPPIWDVMKQFFGTILIALAGLMAPMAVAGPLDEAFEARLLPGWRAADGRHVTALELRLAEGWKTYWRAPGDAGIPPQFDWRGSRNMAGVEITWPTPHVLLQDGVQVIGYVDRLVLPLTITPKRPGKAVQLKSSIDLGVCKDVCVPVSVTVSQELSTAPAKPDPRIVSAIASRPYSATEADVGTVSCRIAPIDGGLRLEASVELPPIGGREVAVVETSNPQVWVAQGDTRRDGKRLTTVSELYHVDGRAFALDRSGLRITVIGGSSAVDIQGCPAG